MIGWLILLFVAVAVVLAVYVPDLVCALDALDALDDDDADRRQL